MPMSPQDHEDNRPLVASYAFALDLGDADAFADCFTDDDSFEIAGLTEDIRLPGASRAGRPQGVPHPVPHCNRGALAAPGCHSRDQRRRTSCHGPLLPPDGDRRFGSSPWRHRCLPRRSRQGLRSLAIHEPSDQRRRLRPRRAAQSVGPSRCSSKGRATASSSCRKAAATSVRRIGRGNGQAR
jgi:hypothetical protein